MSDDEYEDQNDQVPPDNFNEDEIEGQAIPNQGGNANPVNMNPQDAAHVPNPYRLTAEQKQHFDQLPEGERLAYLSPIVNAKINEQPFVDTPAYQERIQIIIESYLQHAKGNYTDADVLIVSTMYQAIRENAEMLRNEDQFRLMEVEEKKKENDFLKELGRDGMKLKEVKEGKMTSVMVEIAIQRNGHAIQFVPYQRRTPEMIKMAIRTTPGAIRWIGYANQTMEYAQLAFREGDPEGLKYIRKDLLEELILLKASAPQPQAQPQAPTKNESANAAI